LKSRKNYYHERKILERVKYRKNQCRERKNFEVKYWIKSKARLYDILINIRSYVNALEILSEKFVMVDRRRKKICEGLFFSQTSSFFETIEKMPYIWMTFSHQTIEPMIPT
jgi:hypothetical protein